MACLIITAVLKGQSNYLIKKIADTRSSKSPHGIARLFNFTDGFIPQYLYPVNLGKHDYNFDEAFDNSIAEGSLTLLLSQSYNDFHSLQVSEASPTK